MKTAIIINLILQIFFAGRFYENQIDFTKGFKAYLKLYLTTLSIILLGDLWVIAYVVICISGFFYHKIWNTLHLGFIIKYIILRKRFPSFDKERHQNVMEKMKLRNVAWWKLGKRIEVKLIYWIDKNYNI